MKNLNFSQTKLKSRKLSKKYLYISKNKIILSLLKLILLNFMIENNIKVLNQLISEIHLVLNGAGENNILSNDYKGILPFEVIVNGVKNDSCERKCYFSEEINNIILRFEGQIESCASMFDSVKIEEIDLSNFDFSKCKSMYYMFWSCTKLEKIIFGNINTSLVENMESLFSNCYQLLSLDLTNFNTSSVTNMEDMFLGSLSLKYLDLSNFNTSKVETIESMFFGCSGLIYLNLKSFKLNNSVIIKDAFYDLSESIKICIEDLETLNYLSVNSDCSNICFQDNIKIDVNNSECIESCSVNGYKFESNNICYSECPKNTYSLFCNETECDTIVNKCFDQKPSGYYFDGENKIYKKCFKNCKECYGEGNEITNNCSECNNSYILNLENVNSLNCYQKCEYYYYFNELKEYYCTKNFSCPEDYNKLIDEKNKCINNCKYDDIYKYEFNNLCYKECPNGTIHNNENYVCYKTNSNDKIYEVAISSLSDFTQIISSPTIETEKTSSLLENNINSTINRIIYSENIKIINISYNINIQEDINLLGITNINTISININTKYNNSLYYLIKELFNNNTNIIKMDIQYEKQDETLLAIQDIIINGLLTNNIDKGKDYALVTEKIIYTITSTLNQKINKNKNETTIDINECENKLKAEYKIPKNDNLYILKIDVFLEKMKTSKTEYEIYYPFIKNNLTKLNLSVCKNSKTYISHFVDISNDEIIKYNASSNLYNDICYSLTNENGIDKPIEDRRNDFIENNMSICEEDCEFIKYDSKTKKAVCSCFTKIKLPLISEIKFDKKKLLNNFKDIRNIANFNMLKCVNKLFDNKNIFKNSANYMIFISIIFSFVAIFSYAFYNFNIIIKKFIKGNNKIMKINNCIRNKNDINSIIKNKNLKRAKDKKETNISKKNKKYYKRNKSNHFQSLQLNLNSINNNNYYYNNDFNDSKKRKRKSKKNSQIIRDNSKKSLKNNKNIIKSKNDIPFLLNDKEINSLKYEIAIKVDDRTHCQYYLSLLRTKHIIIFTFFLNNDYNSKAIKIYIFILTFLINYLISVMFYSDHTMHKIYIDKGSFDLTYQLPKMIYSLIISLVIKNILSKLGLYESNIIQIKNSKNENKKNKELFKIKIKIILFFIITYIILIFFWIYSGCFCAVYSNTQIHLLIEVTSSFAFSFILPFFINLLPMFFRIISLRNKRRIMYKFSKILQIF